MIKLNAQAAGPAALISFLLIMWQIAANHQRVPLLPGPLAVAAGIIELAVKGLLLKDIVASLFRVTWGYIPAVLLGVPLGIAIGWNKRLEMALNPLVQIYRPISPLAWIPVAILWFGVGDRSAVFLIFLASFLPLIVGATNACGSVPQTYVTAGRNFGLGTLQMARLIVLPAILPQLIVSLRLTMGVAWLVVVAAEMMAVDSGLGFLIVEARSAGNRYDLVVAGMVIIGLIGWLLDAVLSALERACSPPGAQRTEHEAA